MTHCETKVCFKCGKEKPVAEFYSNKARPDGIGTSCKPCSILMRRDWSKRNHDYVLVRDRNYYHEHAVAERKSTRDRKVAFPEKTKAHAIIRQAIRTGKIAPLPCFVCGKKADAHHVAYDLPLDVSWLCRSHHLQLHAEVKNYSQK